MFVSVHALVVIEGREGRARQGYTVYRMMHQAYFMRAESLERHCSGVELSSGGRDMSSDTPDSS